MPFKTHEGVVEKGQIRLKSGVKLPENVKVDVIVPELQTRKKKTARSLAPRFTHRKQANDLKMKVGKASSMHKYDAENFDPPAPIAHVSIPDPTTGASSSSIPMLMDTGADVTLLPASSVEKLGLEPAHDVA